MKKSDRRKFLFAGLSLAALAATLRLSKKNTEEKALKPTSRFLTQDGALVEIEIEKIPAVKQAASKQDIKNWIKKNKAL